MIMQLESMKIGARAYDYTDFHDQVYPDFERQIECTLKCGRMDFARSGFVRQMLLPAIIYYTIQLDDRQKLNIIFVESYRIMERGTACDTNRHVSRQFHLPICRYAFRSIVQHF